MYFWTIHPEYLDNKGLIDLWRDGFKALEIFKKKMEGQWETTPFDRFLVDDQPAAAIAEYLEEVACEGHRRDMNFDVAKLEDYVHLVDMNRQIEVPYREICADYIRLMERLEKYDPAKKTKVEASLGLFSRKSHTVQLAKMKPHPMFTIVQPEKKPLTKV